MLKIKKAIVAVSAIVTMISTGALLANAYTCSTEGRLSVSKHYIPALKDTASGYTYTNYGYKETGWNTDKLWTSTYVTAYSKNDSTSASCSSSGPAALEGWDDADAKIRNIKSANGTHKGGSTGVGSQTKYSSWSN
ncbi:hypothetical protein [Ruminococcus flavefaciens]|uniref:hypothetical protein n=1 Tax=Ruminococcus flavefaciens TaxID=1265 RepID=UPI00048AD887|nr:hypothetical protein [Ruminococcus flavefaciens]